MIASTRYSHGDDYTEEQLESMGSRPRRREASKLAAALEARMGDVVRCVPGFDLDVAEPTTIGLGDTFVGGFLAAVAQKEAASWT
jgi:ADP-dependent phosphofructokinase/glucokinase